MLVGNRPGGVAAHRRNPREGQLDLHALMMRAMITPMMKPCTNDSIIVVSLLSNVDAVQRLVALASFLNELDIASFSFRILLTSVVL